MNSGLLQFTSADEIVQKEQQGIEDAQKAAQLLQNSPVMTELASHIRNSWSLNKQAKMDVEQRMIENMRQRKGDYDPTTLRKIQEMGGSDQFIRLTDIKCKAVEGWLKDVLLSPGERPWGIDPTPVSDLKPEELDGIVQQMQGKYNQLLSQFQGKESPEMMQQVQQFGELMQDEQVDEVQKIARKEAKETETVVDDILKEAGWYQALSRFIKDVTTFPAAFVEGPIIENEPQLEWEQNENGSVPVVVEKPTRKYYRLSPFDAYPSPGALSPDEGDFIIKRRFTRSQLSKFKGVEGFDTDSINLVLERFRDGHMDWLSVDTERAELTDRSNRQQNSIGTIDALKYFGSVQGAKLLQWGMSVQEISDPLAEYEVIAYLIDSIVISAKINPHPLKKRGVFCTSYNRSNESLWGDGLPDIIKDIQKICNATVRALVNNMGISSGPQVWFNTDCVPAGTDVTEMYPMKAWPFTGEELQNGVPMGFFQPESFAERLLNVYKFFFEQASEISGIPPYMSGSASAGGAGRTASGLSMLMDAASKTMKDVIGAIDEDVIVKSVKEAWLNVMLYEPEKAKGDIKIIAMASGYLIQKETLQLRRNEFLGATNNPTDMEIMGLDGRAEVLREVAGALQLQKSKVIPDGKSMEAKVEQMKMQEVAQTVADTLGVPVDVIIQASQGVNILNQTSPEGAGKRG